MRSEVAEHILCHSETENRLLDEPSPVLGGRKRRGFQRSSTVEKGGDPECLEAILLEGHHKTRVEREEYEECVLSVEHQVVLLQAVV